MTIYKTEVEMYRWFDLRFKGEPARAMVVADSVVAPQCRKGNEREYVIIEETTKGLQNERYIVPASKFEINGDILPAMSGPWELRYSEERPLSV